ncbi:alpha-hydroxy-acid oxidizing protein [uncultured Jatrophihabitans sp.]|uniref:alpha-hydroxy-acid oxidizing protein n=1 Tax=uncultured Jatrophihabitans sp. TaxID=1610747 RepID=UPI0035CA2E00
MGNPVVGAAVGAGRRVQDRIYRDGVSGRRPRVSTAAETLALQAKRKMSRRAWAYVEGAAGGEATMAANRAAFDRWRLVPRVLRDVSRRDLRTEVLGAALPAPLLLAPIGVLSLAHPDADLAVARAAAAHGVPFVFSNQASVAMEDTAAAMGDAPRWFQLYWSTSDELVDSFLGRAAAIKAGAVVVTLDTTMLGWRPRDLDLGSLPFARGEGIAQYTADPVFRRLLDGVAPSAGRPRITPATVRTLVDLTRNYPGRFADNLRSPLPRAAVETFLRIYSRPSLTFDDLAGLRARTNLPIVLKGVLHPDDARRAVDLGVDGIVVSTHGGRQVDGSIAALDALPDVVAAVDGRATVLLDSGVRSGADIAKAVALGAQAVLVGRPYVYGLAVAGQEGVAAVLDNLIAELDLTLGLCGVTSIAELGPHLLAAAP